MMICRACSKEMKDALAQCPRCGFRQPAVIGDAQAAQALIARKANKHLVSFLRDYDFGVTVYYWKEQKGSIVADRERRLSFGTGDELVGTVRYLEQKFARLPEVSDMELRLSVLKNGKPAMERQVSISVPPGAHLQQLGLELMPSLEFRLKLKNLQGQTESEFLELE